MKKVLQKGLFLTLMFFAFDGYAVDYPLITTYNDLLTTLTQGKNVKGILALHHCTSENKAQIKEMYGSLNFTHFNAYEMEEGKKVIATSTTMLIETKQSGPVYNYVRLRIFTDNSAEVLSEFLDPKTFKVQRQSTYACTLSDSKIQGGVNLYNVS